MEDFKKLSVEGLRKLARKLLGKGYSRLRTRAQLLEALAKVAPAAVEPAPKRKQAVPSVAAAPRPERPVRPRTAKKATARVRKRPDAPLSPAARGGNGVRAAERTTGGAEQPADGAEHLPAHSARVLPAAKEAAGRAAPPPVPVRPSRAETAELAPFARARGVRSRPFRATGVLPAGEGPPANGAPPPRERTDVPPATERPRESAFFEGHEAPRPPRAPMPAVREPPAVQLPPADVGTEAPVLLVRDPNTLFVFWDFRRELERGAALGLAEPRLLLRLFHGERLDRSLELPLGARSTYVEGLHPGESYSAEVLLLGRDGWTRPMGRRSGPRRLPPDGPSERLEVRTLRMAWSEPLAGVRQPSDAVEVTVSEALDSPRRVPLPTSPGARGGGRGPAGPPRSGRN